MPEFPTSSNLSNSKKNNSQLVWPELGHSCEGRTQRDKLKNSDLATQSLTLEAAKRSA